MLGVLRSTVLMSAALLAACAAPAVHDEGPAAMERRDRIGAEQPSFPEGGVTKDAGASVPLTLGLPQDPDNPPTQGVAAPQWGANGVGSGGDEPGVLYAMAYFPAPSGVATERANSLAELYADARAGYGLYSFLLGGPMDARAPNRVAAYGELLRIIDTYVMDNGSAEQGAGRHGFLVQVDLMRRDGELYQRVRPGLTRQIKAVLARQLRMYGHGTLADRLEGSEGPFLVTSLRPAVVPVSPRQSMLIVDLQEVGPEYMYSVVDAYDRPIPGDMLGQPESLVVIERRLLAIFPNRQVDRGAAAAPEGDWIWLIGASNQAQALDADERPDRLHAAEAARAPRDGLTMTTGARGLAREPKEET